MQTTQKTRNSKINFAKQAQLAKLCFATQHALFNNNIAYSAQSAHLFFNSAHSNVVCCNVLRIAVANAHANKAAQIMQQVAAKLQIKLRKVVVRNNIIAATVA